MKISNQLPPVRFGQLYQVQFTNAPECLYDHERIKLLREVEAEIRKQMPKRLNITELLKAAQARLSFPSALTHHVGNVFITQSPTEGVQHYIALGKHRASLLQFIRDRGIHGRYTPAQLPDLFKQWLTLNQPDQTLKATMSLKRSKGRPSTWELQHLKTTPNLPQTIADLWHERW